MSASHEDHDDSHAPAPPPEPKTPMWLPALGAFLFLSVGLWWGLTATPSTDADRNAAPSKGADRATATATAPPTPAPPGSGIRRLPGGGSPTIHGLPGGH